MPSFSRGLEKALHQAMNLARERAHEFATLEHLLLALAESIEHSSGRQAAIDLLRHELEVRPSVRGLMRLVELSGYERGLATGEGRLVSRIGQLLLTNRPVYRCVNCGFSGQQLHWLCPSCKEWETVRPIQGVEAE